MWGQILLLKKRRLEYYLTSAQLSAEGTPLCAPLVDEAQHRGTGGSTFSVAAPLLGNILLRDARLAPSVIAFRRLLKAELFRVLKKLNLNFPAPQIFVIVCF